MPAVPAFIVGLDRSTDRFERVRLGAEARGIAVERLAAVDASTLSPEEIAEWQGRRSALWTPLEPGEIGCFLSHRKAWRLIVERGLPFAFVGEDDIHFAADAALFFDADGWFPPRDLVKAETLLQPTRLAEPTLATVGAHEIHELRDRHLGTAGYFVTAAGARALLEATRTDVLPLDVLLFEWLVFEGPLGFAQITPAICLQDHLVAEVGAAAPVDRTAAAVSSIGAVTTRSRYDKTGPFALLKKLRLETRRLGHRLRRLARERRFGPTRPGRAVVPWIG